ncbi:S-adenosyl-L-methionine-dependent methyltransferase [Lobosporangium transversale]|uniref:S-adenosyl-L-methionine-dependent methyltransferase n=1 Tax=Lobosporangium transversale TaxID=64571 RepID=A0A1Y2GMQ3_9FUNG|nr:S-adenosyl-L-methionine-dependent methyltransferase [Lobosporangium transversale]ORZ16071.1 S-adenosyl-L-methionine-dependent methyltransferase [Lobosporangium transversale]|eukprot:XP_021881418.1 S-adenosyl-L-methionine-dependent methyltransferase [Lobosporangium transversale]
MNGYTPSVIASTANNESFYQQRANTIHSTNGAKSAQQNFRWIDGRRHHNNEDAVYVLPNDIDEMDRLHLQHYVIRHAFNGNTRAKFDGKIHKDVLDVGCGPGTWILEMSTEHTETNFTGIDISAVWPTEIRPRNCRFQVVNAIQGLPFEDNTFDFVYQRFMILAYPAKDWPFIVQELVRVTKPGGIIELTEMPVATSSNGPELTKILDVLERGCISKGLDPKVARKLDILLQEAGIKDVKTSHTSIEIGAWGKKVGQLMRENMAGLWSSLKGWLKELTGMTDAQYDSMIKRIFVEYEDYQCYVNCYCAWGVKPHPTEHLSTSPVASTTLSSQTDPSIIGGIQGISARQPVVM